MVWISVLQRPMLKTWSPAHGGDFKRWGLDGVLPVIFECAFEGDIGFFYFLFFVFLWCWGLNSGPTPRATPPVLFCEGFF
jgi:hypothetical protein